MADPKTLFELTEGSAPLLTDIALTGEDPAGIHVLRKTTWQSIKNLFFATVSTAGTKKIKALVSNPQAAYAQRPQIFIMLTDAAITITRILIDGSDNTPTAEMACDLKWASDMYTGSFADAAVIDVCDTTSGKKLITTGFDDATVAAGKYIYLSLDASPHADWKDFLLEIDYTYD